MGKFDNLFKYLGKESEHTPQVVESNLDKVAGADLTVNEDEISDEAMANVDALLDSFGGGSDNLDELSEIPIGQPEEETQLDLEQGGGESGDLGLEDIAVDAGGAEEDLGEFSEFLSEDSGGEESVPSDFGGMGEEVDEDFASAFIETDAVQPKEDESTIESTEEEPPSFEPETPTPEDTGGGSGGAPEVPEGMDTEVMQELENLDSAPPSLEDIQRKAEGKEKDLIQEMMEEEEGEGGEAGFDMGDFEIEEESGGAQFPEDFGGGEIAGSEEDTSEVSDLLSQLTSEESGTGIETGMEETELDMESGLELPDVGEEMSDLESLLSPEMDLGDSSDMSLEQFQEEGDTGIPLETGEEMDFGELGEEEEVSAMPEMEEGSGDLTDLMEPSPGFSPSGGTPVGDAELTEAEDMGGLEDLMEMPGEELGEQEEAPDLEMESEEPEMDLSALDEFAESEEISEVSGDFDLDEDLSLEEDLQPSPENLRDTTPKPSAYDLPDIEMDEDKAIKIRNRINKIADPDLRKISRKVFLENVLPVDLMEQFVAKLLLHESDEDLKAFLDENVDMEEELLEEVLEEEVAPKKPKGRKVIYAEEARRSQQFQRELGNITKYVGILFVVLVVLGFLFFRFIWKPAMASRHYENGLEAIAEGNYEMAENYFMKGLSVGGTNHGWFIRFAEDYLTVNEDELAVDKFEGSLVSASDDQETIFAYGEYLEEKTPPDFETAVSLYERLVDDDTDDFDIIDKLGMAYIEWAGVADDPEDKYEEAIQTYTDFIVNSPRHVQSYLRLLLVAIRQDNLIKVNTLYDTIADLDNKIVDAEIFTELSEYYIDNRETERAREVMEKLIVYVQNRLKVRNRKKKATEEEKAIFAESFYQYGRFMTLTMDYTIARESLSNTVLLNNEHAQALNLLGELYYITEIITNHSDIAREYFEASIEKDDSYYKPYVNLGHLYYYEKLYMANADTSLAESKALQYYELAEVYMPEDNIEDEFLLHYNLGWLYYKNENYQSAFNQWYPLYMDEPFNPVLSQAMGNTFYHLDQTNLAQSEFEKAIEYYQDLADNVGYINSTLDRHLEIFTQLARSYNNRGVIYVMKARAYPSQVAYYEEKAMLDFYRAKNAADQVDQTYEHAENNIKYLLNQTGFGNRPPSFDDTIPQKTTLQKWIDEFKSNLILNI